MCLSRSSRRVENSCQQCSACWARVFSAIGSRPSRPNSRRSAWVKAVPLVVNASNSRACPVLSSDIEKIPFCRSTFVTATRYPGAWPNGRASRVEDFTEEPGDDLGLRRERRVRSGDLTHDAVARRHHCYLSGGIARSWVQTHIGP